MLKALKENESVIFVEALILFLIVWAVIGKIFALEGTISSPVLVASELYDIVISGEVFSQLATTGRRVGISFVITMLVGTGLGFLLGMFKFWDRAFTDYVSAGLAFPSLFVAIFAAMWFGVSDFSPIVAATLISFPFVTRNVYEGVKNIDANLLGMSRSFEVPSDRAIRRVMIPSVLPMIFAGARLGLALCWKIVTLGELIAATSGIGFMISKQMEILSITGVLAWTVVFAILIFVIEYVIFKQIENVLFKWRKEVKTSWLAV